jgi:hypothetical protein
MKDDDPKCERCEWWRGLFEGTCINGPGKDVFSSAELKVKRVYIKTQADDHCGDFLERVDDTE